MSPFTHLPLADRDVSRTACDLRWMRQFTPGAVLLAVLIIDGEPASAPRPRINASRFPCGTWSAALARVTLG